MTVREPEKERRDSLFLVLLIVLLGFLCIILSSGWALRFAPSWRLPANMGSNLNPDDVLLTRLPSNVIQPFDPGILTLPAWYNSFLTPGATFKTSTQPPPLTVTSFVPPTRTITPVPTTSRTATPTVFIPLPINTATRTPVYTAVGSTSTLFVPTPTWTPSNIPALLVDLQITKTDGVATYTAGSTVTYTVVVTNNGPGNVIGAVVSDPKPSQVTTWGWCIAPCTPVANGSATLSDTFNLTSGASRTYTILANINPGASGNLVNTASVAVPAGYTDTNPGNNSATDTDTPDLAADLQITKTDGVVVYTPGTALTYTIIVTNTGPGSVVNAVVSDAKPLQVTTWSWVCTSQNNGASGCDGVTNSAADFTDTVNLPNGASIEYTVTAQVSASATGDLVNTASVAVPLGYTDTNPGNNSATDTDALQFSDLTITKTDNVTEYSPGGVVNYTITVTNTGSVDLTGVTLSDPKPTQVSEWRWSCNKAIPACTPTFTTGNFTSPAFDLPVGDSVIFTALANINNPATGNLSNTATVTAGSLVRSATDVDMLDTFEPEIGPPDGGYIVVGSQYILDLGAGNAIAYAGAAEPAWDFVYFERWFLDSDGTAKVHLDCIEVQVGQSATGPWHRVFYWCDNVADTNSNVDINVIGGSEPDNRAFPPPPLYAHPFRPDLPTGVAIDIDAPLMALGLPPGNYQYIRFLQTPEGGGDGPEIDSVYVLP